MSFYATISQSDKYDDVFKNWKLFYFLKIILALHGVALLNLIVFYHASFCISDHRSCSTVYLDACFP